MWLLLSLGWVIAVGLCLVAIIGGIWQYPPLALPVLYLAWRAVRWTRRVAREVRVASARKLVSGGERT